MFVRNGRASISACFCSFMPRHTDEYPHSPEKICGARSAPKARSLPPPFAVAYRAIVWRSKAYSLATVSGFCCRYGWTETADHSVNRPARKQCSRKLNSTPEVAGPISVSFGAPRLNALATTEASAVYSSTFGPGDKKVGPVGSFTTPQTTARRKNCLAAATAQRARAARASAVRTDLPCE